MSKIFDAMLEMASVDELAGGGSFIHKRHPLPKLVLTVVFIICVASFGVDNLSGLLPMSVLIVVMYIMSDIPVQLCFYKLRFILPLILAVGIWNPILNRTPVARFGTLIVSAGMISLVTLMLKSLLALMASFWLIATTGIEEICYALRTLYVPEILVTLILITYRYISLLLKEADTMTSAYSLRAPGQKGIHVSAWGSFLGQLLLRSMDRATGLYDSMKLRGYNGSFYYSNHKKADKYDYLFFFLMGGLIVLFRIINISELLGGLFV